MTLRPFLRKAARQEYDDAIDWYEAQHAGLGAEFVEAVERALLDACEMPRSFRLVLADVRRAKVRRFPYFVYFRVRASSLIVIAMFHVRRDPMIWRGRVR